MESSSIQSSLNQSLYRAQGRYRSATGPNGITASATQDQRTAAIVIGVVLVAYYLKRTRGGVLDY